MRKALAVLVILSAASFIAHGASAAKTAAPKVSSPTEALTLAKGARFAIDRVGGFKYALVTAPGFSTENATVNSGFAVDGGKVEFLSPPRTVLRDTPAGLVVAVSFVVKSFTGSPSLVLQGSTIAPR